MEQIMLENCALAALRTGGCGAARACAHGIQDVALPGLKSQDGLEAFLCRCLRANCRVSSGVSRRFEMANTMPP